jgi:hypothetical protein
LHAFEQFVECSVALIQSNFHARASSIRRYAAIQAATRLFLSTESDCCGTKSGYHESKSGPGRQY